MDEMKSVSVNDVVLATIDQMGLLKKRLYSRVYKNLGQEAKDHLMDEVADKISAKFPAFVPVFNATDFSGETKFTVAALDWASIIKLVMENLPGIIAMIMKLFNK